jgi:hypothetical protein
MNNNILRVIIALIAIILIIKLVPPVNEAAREYLPTSILKLIGEQPKGIFEKTKLSKGSFKNNFT